MCLKKGSRLIPKELKIGNKKNVYEIHLLKMLDNYNMVRLINNLLSSMRNHCRVIGVDHLIIKLQLNWLTIIESVTQTNNMLF